MKTRFGLLAIPVAALALALGACSTSSPEHPPARHPAAQGHTVPSTTVVPAPKIAALTVPTDLVGASLGDAKAKLAKLGFTDVVVAGGQVTDADPVTSVAKAGQKMPANAKLVLVGKAPTHAAPPESTSPGTGTGSSSDACLADATQCYVNGQHCVTGSCVNAARGLTPDDVRRGTDEYLRQHPGQCAYGETGAVGPCDSWPGGHRPGS